MVRNVILLAVPILILLATVGGPHGEPQQVWIGDAAPPLEVDAWIMGEPTVPGDANYPIRIVEFWATWCPASRLVLQRQDSLLSAGEWEQVEIIAVSQEQHPALLGAFVEAAGWDNLVIGCDADREALEAYFDAATSVIGSDFRTFPFAFMIGGGPRAERGTILWMGPVVSMQYEQPMQPFETAVQQILAGGYDLDTASRIIGILGGLDQSQRDGDLKVVGHLLSELDKEMPIPLCAWGNLILLRMNAIAWDFATGQAKTEEHLGLARRAVAVGLGVGGESHPSFVDTHARVLYETGQVSEAYAMQKRAIQLAQDSLSIRNFQAVLERYAREPGLASEDTAASAETATQQVMRPPEVAVVPDSVSLEGAAEDLIHLHEIVRERYAGYADVAWSLERHGSSWSERTQDFGQRIQEREIWDWEDFYMLIREYLEPVEDSHFSIMVDTMVDTTVTRRAPRTIQNLVPSFADILVESHGLSFRVAEAEQAGYLGAEIQDAPVVVTPYTVEIGTPYLFATLCEKSLKAGDFDHSAFLLRMFGALKQPPESVAVLVRLISERAGEAEQKAAEMRLRLHRGRAALAREPEATWALTLPPDSPLPVLAVRTTYEPRLEGMVETADTLRDLPSVVLDLGANPGGGDTPTMDWCQRFSGQRYNWVSGAWSVSGDRNPIRTTFYTDRCRGGLL